MPESEVEFSEHSVVDDSQSDHGAARISVESWSTDGPVLAAAVSPGILPDLILDTGYSMAAFDADDEGIASGVEPVRSDEEKSALAAVAQVAEQVYDEIARSFGWKDRLTVEKEGGLMPIDAGLVVSAQKAAETAAFGYVAEPLQTYAPVHHSKPSGGTPDLPSPAERKAKPVMLARVGEKPFR